MEKEMKILMASGVGLLVALGIWGLKKYLDHKNLDKMSSQIDEHRHFDYTQNEEDHHGVEYLSMK